MCFFYIKNPPDLSGGPGNFDAPVKACLTGFFMDIATTTSFCRSINSTNFVHKIPYLKTGPVSKVIGFCTPKIILPIADIRLFPDQLNKMINMFTGH
jgi:hypothetical protein